MKNQAKQAHKRITEQVIALLERGTVPWQKPWYTIANANPYSGVTYQGVNQSILNMAAALHGYEYPFWMTYNQAKANGTPVRKGGKGHGYCLRWVTKTIPAKEDGDEPMSYPVCKMYTLFNVVELDGFDLSSLPLPAPRELAPANERHDALLSAWQDAPPIEHTGNHAVYFPQSDRIALPKRTAFRSETAYYAVLAHELGHSTGHSKRLSRPDLVASAGMQSKAYAREELTAEMFSAYWLSELGLASEQQTEQSAAYIDSWLKALANDHRLVHKAMSQASAAIHYVLEGGAKAVV